MMLIWIIALGLLNILLFIILYAIIGGDAPNGKIEAGNYYVRGHFLRHGPQGHSTPVSAAVWIYSYLHSITLFPTMGAVLCSMLLLARPHIIATMREENLSHGQYFVASSMTLIVFVNAAMMLYFLISLFQAWSMIRSGGDYGG